MSFACIHIPELSLQAILRAEPDLQDQPVAVIDGPPSLSAVIALNAKGWHAGVKLGMTEVQAKQVSSVQFRRRATAGERAAHAALLDLGFSFSPRVEDRAPGTVILDLAGLSHLFHSPENMACRIEKRAGELGLRVHITLASNPDAAEIAARGFPGTTFIAPGEEARWLAPLPLPVLTPGAELLEILDGWGVRTLGELASLPPEAVAVRLGQEAARLQSLACGWNERPLIPAQPPLRFEETLELEYPIALLEPLVFVFSRLLHALCLRLASRGFATNELCLEMDLDAHSGADMISRKREKDPHPPAAAGSPSPASGRGLASFFSSPPKHYQKKMCLAVPVRDPKFLLTLLQLNMESDPPPAPILKVSIAATPARPVAEQGGLFLPSHPDPQRLEILLARLTKLVGAGYAGSPEIMDTRRPGAFRMQPFQGRVAQSLCGSDSAVFSPRARSGDSRPRDRPASLPSSHGTRASLALRAFRPPLPASVELRGNCPVHVSSSRVRGEVVTASGPWRASGDWWSERAWSREAWDIEIHGSIPAPADQRRRDTRAGQPLQDAGRREMSGAGLYRIYRDLALGSWFIDGMYD